MPENSDFEPLPSEQHELLISARGRLALLTFGEDYAPGLALIESKHVEVKRHSEGCYRVDLTKKGADYLHAEQHARYLASIAEKKARRESHEEELAQKEGMLDSPARAALYAYAYEEGHSYSLEEVQRVYEEVASVIRLDRTERAANL